LNRHHLRREDLEDCYSQATLELLAHVRQGGAFEDRRHLANALELRFSSRVRDRHRALAGRSPMQAALETAFPLSGADEQIVIVDQRADVERLLIARQDLALLRLCARELSDDQRLVLGWQLGPPARGCAEFCGRYGWSKEKYRKVAQRARARLRTLMSLSEGVPALARPSEREQGPYL
jgi:hypothetical protein